MNMMRKNRFMRNHWLIAIIFASLLVMFVLHIIFKMPAFCDFFTPEWSAGDALSYMGTIEGSVVAIYVLRETIFSTIEAERENRAFSIQPHYLIKTFASYDDIESNDGDNFLLNTRIGKNSWNGKVFVSISLTNVGGGNAVTKSISVSQINNSEKTLEYVPPLVVGVKQGFIIPNCKESGLVFSVIYSDIANLVTYETKLNVSIVGSNNKVIAICESYTTTSL